MAAAQASGEVSRSAHGHAEELEGIRSGQGSPAAAHTLNTRVYRIQKLKSSTGKGKDLFEGFQKNGARDGDGRYTWHGGDTLVCTFGFRV